jgi:transcriptional regulator with XRE-family HTH domain
MEQTKIDLIKLGQTIRFRRQGKGWSLSDLAEHSGLSKAYISDVENGAAGKPNVQYLFQIAEALDTTIDGLLNESRETPAPKPRKAKHDLPAGLADLQQELNLTDDDVERLAAINFRGDRPRDKEGWRFLLQTLQLLGQRKRPRQ